MITVIIPCYNSAKFVNKAIDSVIKQTYADWKIIAVDDCSTDDTLDVLQSYANANDKIRVIKNEVNLGVGMSRRNALKDVDTEFVTFLDSDDEFEPEYLEMLTNIQKSCDADIVYSRVKLHFDDPKLKNYDPTNQSLLTECMMTGSGRMQTQIDMRQKQSEDNFVKWGKKVGKGMKLNDSERSQYGKLKKYAQEHNGSPLFERNSHGEVIMPKYDLISTHTARRSGITNLYKQGIFNTREMMAMSGHQSEKVFENYIKVGVSEQADRIAEKVRMAREKKLKKSKEA
jgi:glycosyltransferase involved in cell wall biosynthesis